MKRFFSFLLVLFLTVFSFTNVNASQIELNTNHNKVADYIRIDLDDEITKELSNMEGWGLNWTHLAFKEGVWGLNYYETGLNQEIRNTHKISPSNIASIDMGKGVSKAQLVIPMEGNKDYNPVEISLEKVKKGYWFPKTYEVIVLKASKRVDNIELVAAESIKIHDDIRIEIKNDENGYFSNSIKQVLIGENETTDYELGKDSIKIYASNISEAGEYELSILSDFYDKKTVKINVINDDSAVLKEYPPMLSIEKKHYSGWVSSYDYYTIKFEDGSDYIKNLKNILVDETSCGDSGWSLDNNEYKTYSDKIELRADDSKLSEEGVTLKFVANGYTEQVVKVQPDLSFTIEESNEEDIDTNKKETPKFESAELKYVPAGWLSSEYSYYIVNFEGDEIASYLENIENITVGEISYEDGYPSTPNKYDIDGESLKLGMAGFVDGEDTDIWIEAKDYKNLHFTIKGQKEKTAPIVAEVKVKLMPITSEVAPQLLEQYFTNLQAPNMESAEGFFGDISSAEYYLKPFKDMDKLKLLEIAKYFRPAYARFAFDGSDKEIKDYLDNVDKLIVNGVEYDYKPILATDMIADIIDMFPENTAASFIKPALGLASSKKAYFYAEKDGVPFNPDPTGATNLLKNAYYMDLSASHFTSSGLGNTSVIIKANGYQDVIFDFNTFVGAKNYETLGEAPSFEDDDAVFVENATFSNYCRIDFTGDETAVNNYLLQITKVVVDGTAYNKHSSLLLSKSYILSKEKIDVLAPYRYLDLDMDAFEPGKETTVSIKARGYDDMTLTITRPKGSTTSGASTKIKAK